MAFKLIVNLELTTFFILVPSFVCFSLLTLAEYKFPAHKIISLITIIFIYVFIELHFFYSSDNYFLIIYWMPFIPLLALILFGRWSALTCLIITLLSLIVNTYYLSSNLNDGVYLKINSTLIVSIAALFTITFLSLTFFLYKLMSESYIKMKLKAEELSIVKDEIESKRLAIEKYQTTLLSLSQQKNIYSTEKDKLFQLICKTAATTLEISRVSIWVLENNNQQITRKFLFEKENLSDEQVILYKSDFPAYFHALETKAFISADIAREHEDTKDFTKVYFTPLNIYSLFDCPLIIDQHRIGVICCEHQNEIRKWKPEEASFIQSLADFIAINFKNQQIKELLEEIRLQNTELQQQGNEISSFNEELTSLNEELAITNYTLEATVKRRTIELEKQNEYLTEYAFINSHLLRAPLARIMGLSTLLSIESKESNCKELIEALTKSSYELDLIIRKITDVLYKGNNLSREDINTLIEKNLTK